MSGGDSRSKVGVYHLVWGMLEDPVEPFERFVASYRRHAAGVGHELVIILKGVVSQLDLLRLRAVANTVPHVLVTVDERELDIGAYYAAAIRRPHETVCFLNTYSEILGANWLAKMVANLSQPGVGLVGCSGSYEAPHHGGRYDNIPFPNPHLRTNAFALRHEVFFKVRPSGSFTDKLSTYLFEHQRSSLTRSVAALGLDILVVGRDGKGYTVNEWPISRTFRQGEQSNLLIGDNRTRDFVAALPTEKRHLSALAWGDRASGEVRILPREGMEQFDIVAAAYEAVLRRLPTIAEYQAGARLLAANGSDIAEFLEVVKGRT